MANTRKKQAAPRGRSNAKKKKAKKRSADFQPLTNDDLSKLLKETKHPGIKDSLKDMVEMGLESFEGTFLLHDGNLEVSGSFDPDDSTVLVIRGNLSVSKLYRDRCNDAPSNVIVFGNLSAKNIYTAGYLEVTGNLTATEALVGDYNDGGALIHKNLTTSLFLPFDHGFDVRGKTVVKEKWDRAWDKSGNEMLDVCVDAKGKRVKASRLAKSYYRSVGEDGYRLFGGRLGEKEFSRNLIAGKSVVEKR